MGESTGSRRNSAKPTAISVFSSWRGFSLASWEQGERRGRLLYASHTVTHFISWCYLALNKCKFMYFYSSGRLSGPDERSTDFSEVLPRNDGSEPAFREVLLAKILHIFARLNKSGRAVLNTFQDLLLRTSRLARFSFSSGVFLWRASQHSEHQRKSPSGPAEQSNVFARQPISERSEKNGPARTWTFHRKSPACKTGFHSSWLQILKKYIYAKSSFILWKNLWRRRGITEISR